MKKLLILLAIFASASSDAQGQKKVSVNFPQEAWYSIFRGNEKLGYFYSRYDWVDSKQNQIRYSSTLIRKMEGKFFEEQLIEQSSADLLPISLGYRQFGDGVESFIQLDIKNNVAHIKKRTGSDEQKKEVSIPQGSLFGSFVNYMFLTIRNTMDPKQNYLLKVLDEGDYSIKDCYMKILSKQKYLLSCDKQDGVYEIAPTGLIVSQSADGGQLKVKKTSQKLAMKGFPKPGSQREK